MADFRVPTVGVFLDYRRDYRRAITASGRVHLDFENSLGGNAERRTKICERRSSNGLLLFHGQTSECAVARRTKRPFGLHD